MKALRRFLTSFLIIALTLNAVPLSHLAIAESTNGENVSDETIAKDYLSGLKTLVENLAGIPSKRHPLDFYSLLQQRVNPRVDIVDGEKVPKIRAVPWWDLQLEVREFESSHVIDVLSLRQNQEFDTAPRTIECKVNQTCRFTLKNSKTSEVLNDFFIPSQQVTIFGHYLVFLKDSEFTEPNGVQNLSVVDLESYNASVGNEIIPVFEIPIHMSEPLTTLQANKEYLILNGKKRIHAAQIQDLSMLYRVIFNISSRLADPDAVVDVAPMADSLVEYLDRTQNSVQAGWDTNPGVEAGNVALEQMVAQYKDRIANMRDPKNANIVQPSKETKLAAERLKSEALNEESEGFRLANQFTTEIEKMDVINKTLQGQQKLARDGRKVSSKLSWLGSYMMSPRPRAAAKLQESLARLIVGTANAVKIPAGFVAKVAARGVVGSVNIIDKLTAGFRSSMKEILEIGKQPLATAGLAAAVSLAVISPESYWAFGQHAMNFTGEALGLLKEGLGHVLSPLKETSIGDLWLVAKSNTFQSYGIYADLMGGSWFKTINDAYIAGNNWVRFGIGMGALFSSMAVIWLVPHLTVNVYKLLKDRVKFRGETFVERQNRLHHEYLDALAASAADLQARAQKKSEAAAKNFGPEDELAIDDWITNKIANTRALKGKKLSDFDLPKAKAPTEITTVTGAVKDFVVGPVSALNTLEASRSVVNDMIPSPATAEATIQASNEQVAAVQEAADALQASPALVKLAEKPEKDRKGFFQALKSFVFSYANFNNTLMLYVRTWNAYSLVRYCSIEWGRVNVCGVKVPVIPIKLKPITFSTLMLYPNFILTTVSRRVGKVTLPTELNGGTRSLVGSIASMVSYWMDPMSKVVRAATKTANKDFENKILDLEDKVIAEATRKSLEALPHFIKDQEELNELFESGGTSRITSAAVKQLNMKNRTFVRLYFEELYEKGMKEALGRVLARVAPETLQAGTINSLKQRLGGTVGAETLDSLMEEEVQPENFASMSLAEMKQMVINYNAQTDLAVENQIKVDAMDEKEVKEIVQGFAADNAVFEKAQKKASSFFGLAKSALMNLKHNIVSNLDPEQNPSMKRFAVVQEKLRNPMAMARAIRQEISDMFVTLPIDLGFTLLLVAGITEGIAKPLQDTFMGPNSTAYMSHYTFYGGFLMGWAMGILANSWVKLQEDAVNDDEGNFGHIPTPAEHKQGFLKWAWQKTFSKENSFKKTYANYFNIVFWNIPAAIFNIELFKFIFLGRLEFDPLIAGYLLTFLLPSDVFRMKMDQGFETALHYDAGDLPKKEYIAHPRVQKVMQNLTQWRRNRWNLLRDLVYSNNVGGWVANLPTITAPGFGPRSFVRILSGGTLTFDEKLVAGAGALAEKTQNVPVIKSVTSAIKSVCETLLDRPDLVRPK